MTTHIDLSLLKVISPDDAGSRLSFVMGHFPAGIAWSSRVSDREGTYQWSPDVWTRNPGRQDTILDSAIHAVMIHTEVVQDG